MWNKGYVKKKKEGRGGWDYARPQASRRVKVSWEL